ncbi:MAG: DEAD/DEAH box helicase [Saccharolobus sp.]|uniref:DEAD/DEAH box helicase n=1 Tax=Saccharolobus TaxID=2100760 RepID=UPI001F0F5814|nr:DEAD/DEAH box helicase [Saccharolobus shibatae]MCH4815095.1 DEAD/DEAH box helicase [Saccharolobus shibatae]
MLDHLDQRLRKLIEEKKWIKLTRVQEMSYEPITNGYNTLIIAPTGYGKTEAAMFPILNRMLKEDVKPVTVIYITPLKALINDLLYRIDWWASRLGFLVNRKHGEVPQKEKNLRLKRIPHIIVTTPEGLEIDLDWASRFREHYKNVKWVIVDEIHELINSKRGTQLSILLERLKHFIGYDFQRIGLSATVSDENKVAQFLFGSSERKMKIIRLNDTRNFEIKINKIDNNNFTLWRNAAEKINQLIEKPTLVFTNSRFSTERLHEELEKLGNKEIYVHHSSVSRDLKNLAEGELRNGNAKAVVCTKTLELGIHVGDIKKVIMLRPPTSVSSFLQRLGRSGHIVHGVPKGEIICFYDFDVLESLALYLSAKDGKMEKPFIDDGLDVVAREIVGMVLQNQKMSIEEAFNIIRGTYIYRKLELSRLMDLIQYLVKNNIIKIEENYLKLGQGFFKIWRFNRDARSSWGKDFSEFFSLINNDETFALKHNGITVGEIDAVYVYKHVRANDVIRISGKFWKVLRINTHKNTIDVTPANEGEGEIPIWKGENTSKSSLIVDYIRKIIENFNEYYLTMNEIMDKNSKESIIKIFEEYRKLGLKIPSGDIVLVENKEDEWLYTVLIDERISNTLSHILLYLVTKKYTLNASSRSSIYGFSIKGTPVDLFKDIINMDERKIVKIVLRSILRSPLYIATLKEIQPSFGKISKINTKEDKFLIKEALRQTIKRYFSIKKTLEFIRKVREGKIKMIYTENAGLLREAIFAHAQIRPWLSDLNLTIYQALKGGAYTVNELSEILGISAKSLENKLKQLRRNNNKYKVTLFVDVDSRETRWCLYEDFIDIVKSEEYYSSFSPLNNNEIFAVNLKSGDNQVEILFKPFDLINNPEEILRKIPFNNIEEVKVREAIDTSYQFLQKYYHVGKDSIVYLLLNAVAYLQSLKYS